MPPPSPVKCRPLAGLVKCYVLMDDVGDKRQLQKGDPGARFHLFSCNTLRFFHPDIMFLALLYDRAPSLLWRSSLTADRARPSVEQPSAVAPPPKPSQRLSSNQLWRPRLPTGPGDLCIVESGTELTDSETERFPTGQGRWGFYKSTAGVAVVCGRIESMK